MVKQHVADARVTESSGNVFADMGLAEPEEDLTKAQLASQIRAAIKRQRLTLFTAAARLGLGEREVSAVLNGRLVNISSEQLRRSLMALGQDVEITVRTKPRNRVGDRIRILEEGRR
jgi:predicted XRE-type DNA-binding protein